ncbi:MAG: bifunctional diaminohydroxyphosphoribosylaminopyrimidine deaminase/5-amino-6-(5-phosphoribosylamino)uracil reductase RibD [Candidatus Eremiobacteraeota bacterium]|nr:bifunctional diaminohydroxyphosphoribosylaminopyrimidine deaminase/5-amino-6-(5-phosphoribosylamino)uracil reductase RibD [Candidatus Eremiobacteraeota bacterium]
MERRRNQLNGRDRLYLERADELAARGAGNTSPNPPVGAVVVREGEIAGEGYHHKAGDAHAEVEALRAAGSGAGGATMYVSLEPCNHFGKTPPCSRAVIAAGIRRVVVGSLDPNPKTGGAGIAALQAAGIDVTVATGQPSRLLESFNRSILHAERPYIALKMAASLDGLIASESGIQHWLTGPQARQFVRDLRTSHDAVMVGAGTVRVDDPQLTVRPPRTRLRPYVRVVVCETDAIVPESNVLKPAAGYDRTILLAPAGARERFDIVRNSADVVYVGDNTTRELDLAAAMRALRERGINSVLCEGGPTIAGRLLSSGLIDRMYWLLAPAVLGGPGGVKALNLPEGSRLPSIAFDTVERLGEDLLLSGTVKRV